MDAKLAQVYYRQKSYWKGVSSIKKLAEENSFFAVLLIDLVALRA